MPRRLKQQRRGKGKPVYRPPTHRWKGKVSYPREIGEAEIKSIYHGPGINSPLMEIRLEGKKSVLPAPIGVAEGDRIHIGEEVAITPGNILPLRNIPEGTRVFNIEIAPGDGGKLVRGSGCSARVVSKDQRGITLQLPSKSMKIFNPNCRATVGIIAGGGKREKPIVKAGKKHHMLRSKAKIWPHVAGGAMNPVDHPFGGGMRRHKKRKTVSRTAPPGRKVGSLAAKKTGRKKLRK
jgi:large subunit ribosomal protein L2